MNSKLWKTLMACTGAAALAFAAAPAVVAQCGLPISEQLNGGARPPLVRTALEDDFPSPSIVGMWHVVFTAFTSNGAPVPGGVVIDNSVVLWHPDGTEIMNSSRSAQDGNFCLGIWKQTGPRSYVLNHIPWQGNVFDPSVPADTVGPPQDGAQLLEKITLNPDGNAYSGTFILTAYTSSGTVYQTFTGMLSAKRITVDTPFTDLL
jgi:hypothetical protein